MCMTGSLKQHVFFNYGKFKISFSVSPDMSVCCSNPYIRPEINLAAQDDHIKVLGVFMSADCSFDHHISWNH